MGTGRGHVQSLFHASMAPFCCAQPWVSFTLVQEQDGVHFADFISKHDNILRKKNLLLLAPLSWKQDLSPDPFCRHPTLFLGIIGSHALS